ncbi:helix-turn-helix transcriptional regulator [Candidatus Saccharibacteria bacterium]|nr:helix-turn-helix transcriptional regulator [Candidatus Saccharibacteria bacterium]
MEEQESTCGIAQALAVIGGKWTLLIVRDLLAGERRFSVLEESLSGISPRTLAARLKELETDGIVTRDCSTGHPIYALTDRGVGLSAILDQMRAWGEAKVS